ncbi:diaminopimelate epimerase [Agrobacterium sp. DKPNP3]|uniref:diaminopimelate epimerase n=1 Tax=Agrobacterium sp. DKPNP3 TaxID=3457323 RepID=UPI00404497BD
MELNSEKMHANGDDFAIVDWRHQPVHIDRTVVARMGNRNRGIGFNQLATISDCDHAAAQTQFFNSDGSSLNACGSATRGVALKLMQEADVSSVTVRTNHGLLTCTRDSSNLISVTMEEPLLDWRDVPLSNMDTLVLPLQADPSACSMGNPHCTYFVDDLDDDLVGRLGSEIERHPLFPQRTNVHFVRVGSRSKIWLRIWERGGGIPLGSGSCSFGAVVNGIRRGFLDTHVEVECDGGSVLVEWVQGGQVLLSGPAAPLFRGTWCCATNDILPTLSARDDQHASSALR